MLAALYGFKGMAKAVEERGLNLLFVHVSETKKRLWIERHELMCRFLADYLCYFFDYALFYVGCPKHLWDVDCQKQP